MTSGVTLKLTQADSRLRTARGQLRGPRHAVQQLPQRKPDARMPPPDRKNDVPLVSPYALMLVTVARCLARQPATRAARVCIDCLIELQHRQRRSSRDHVDLCSAQFGWELAKRVFWPACGDGCYISTASA
jgi:hypothetical protein